jgi:hypothetical protein
MLKPRSIYMLLLGLMFSHVVSSQGQTIHVTIDAKQELTKINPFLYGLNVARWDEGLFPGPTTEMLLSCDRDAIEKVRCGGFTLLKYPGGNDADHYVWNSPDNSAGEMDTDEYGELLKTVGAVGFITVNYNESPALAADWVRYCNNVKGYNVPFWEVGDEQWGSWARGHTTPESYAARYIEFVKAMKGVDPTIRIAINVKPTEDPNGWTYRVLKAAGEYVDMVTFTYYPLPNTKENEDSLLASVARFRQEYKTISNVIHSAMRKEKADTMWIINVGYNSISGYPGPITVSLGNSLYIADMLGSMAELGTQMACYWALHNAYPPRGGDYGILSAEGRNIPTYNYYIFPLFTQYFGKTLLKTTNDDPTVSAYSSLEGNDTLSVILINKDRKKGKPVDISVRDFSPTSQARMWIIDGKRKLERLPNLKNIKPSFSLNLTPYSITCIQLLRVGAQLAPQNIALGARATASSLSLTDPNLGPSSAVDGKGHTRWASAAWASKDGSDQQWYQIDFGSPKIFDRIVIRWAKGFGTEYSIATSRDKKRWDKVVNQGKGMGKSEEFNFTPVTARYIKLTGSKGSKAISSYSIYEFEIYNTGEERSFR